MNAVSYQLIKVGLDMLTEPKKPKRKMVAKTKQRRPRVVGRAQTAGCSATHGAPQYTRENITVHQGEHHSAPGRM